MWPLLLLSVLAPAPADVQVWDRTGVVMPFLLETFTDNELAGAGTVTIAWAETIDLPSAMVPYNASAFPECANIDGTTFPERCILIDADWWPEAGGYARQEPALTEHHRALIAHEFGHVLSLERKETDRDYGRAVLRVDEECLADAVATTTLVRASYAPPAVHYECDDYWMQAYGEDRTVEALALAEDLLYWAAHHNDPPPAPEPLPAPSGVATATAQATRLPSTEG